jgi:hypothetical protein
LEQKAGFARGDSAEDRLAKLAAVLAETDPSPEDVAVVAELLSIPKEAGYPALELSPQRRKERVFAALAHRLASFARQAPVLFLFEDAHWSDPTSLELLDAVVERVPALPVLAVISFRPDFSPSWFGRAGVSQIILGRLDSREATELAERVTRDHALSPALLDRIVVQADGVPLFIEELAKAVQETTELSPGSTLTVPDTLQASLMARLDRLPAAKQVAQIGAVIGREFSHTLLEAVVQMPESQLARGIEELVASGLVFRSGTPPEAVYTFKHALVQDVAYESLLRSRRAEAHAAVADHLEQESGSAGERAALIGFHCAHAGAAARAAAYYRLAGEQLEKHGSFSETESLLRRGLLLIDPLAHGPERQRLEAELLFALGHLLYIKVGISSSAAHQALDKAVAKSRELNDVGLLSRALRDRSAGLMQRGDLRAALIDAHELQQVIGGSDDVKTRILADVLTSSVQFHRGQFTSAHVHMNSAEELNGIGQARDFDVTHESNWVVTGIFFGVFSLCCLGFIERSNGKMAHLWEEARRQTPFHHAINLANFSRFELIATHNKTAVARLTSDLDLLAQEHGFPQYLLVAKMNQGYLDATIRGSKAGVETARQAFAEMRAAGHERWGPYHHFLIADALACGEDTAEALSTLSDGLAMSAKTEEVWLDSELHRLRGELLLKTTEPEPLQAEQALRTAIDIARGQSAKLFELRAAMSLALLWCGQGRRTEAHDLLAPVYDWFTEGFGSTDLQEARAVLAELGRLR